jgi:hypothetical protein
LWFRPTFLRPCPSSPPGLILVEAVFVRHIPIGKDDDPWSKAFALSTLFRGPNFEVDIVPVLEPFTEFALKTVSPFGVILNNLLEVIEKLSVGVHPRDFNVRQGVTDQLALKKWHLLQTLQSFRYLVKRAVQFGYLLE